jgi:Holliday junction resolvase RusA-like endonuclease
VLSEIYLFGNPIPQGSARAFNRGGKVVVTSDNKNLKKWREYCATILRLKLAGPQPIDGPVEVLLDFYIERPKSHLNGSGTLRKGYTFAHISKPDTDKLVRAVLDSCTDAGVWNDDAQVVRLTATKNYATKVNLPGVRVVVRKVVGND